MNKRSNVLIAWLHILRFLSHVNSASIGATNKFEQLRELTLCMSWNPGERCDTTLVALNNKTRFTGDCYLDHAISEKNSVDHKYCIGFDVDPTDNDYFLDICFDRVSIGNKYCYHLVAVYPVFGYHCNFGQVQEHRAQWDPGGHRLGVKPSFKEGGC